MAMTGIKVAPGIIRELHKIFDIKQYSSEDIKEKINNSVNIINLPTLFLDKSEIVTIIVAELNEDKDTLNSIYLKLKETILRKSKANKKSYNHNISAINNIGRDTSYNHDVPTTNNTGCVGIILSFIVCFITIVYFIMA